MGGLVESETCCFAVALVNGTAEVLSPCISQEALTHFPRVVKRVGCVCAALRLNAAHMRGLQQCLMGSPLLIVPPEWHSGVSLVSFHFLTMESCRKKFEDLCGECAPLQLNEVKALEKKVNTHLSKMGFVW